jgi:F-type H+-transporting ATPase subunit c
MTMSKSWTWMVLLGLVLLASSATALAQPPAPAEGGAAGAAAVSANDAMGKGFAIIGACLGAGLSALGGAYGIGRIGQSCMESVARQPEAAGTMFAPMIITAAMIEGGMLFAVVVCLLGVLFS